MLENRKENYMKKEEIKKYLEHKMQDFIPQVLNDNGDSIHLAVIGTLWQILKDYDEDLEGGNIKCDYGKLTPEVLDEIIRTAEQCDLASLDINAFSEFADDYESTSGCTPTYNDYIERVLYWLVADAIDIL